MIRPDGRRFVRAGDLPESPDGEVYCTVSEADAEWLALCERLGFAVNRRESRYLAPTDPMPAARTGDDQELSQSRSSVCRVRCTPSASSPRNSPTVPCRSATTSCVWIVSRFTWRE